ncbi:MAG: hypothetical protein HY564_02545 [Candidatus Jacksonbacteria bacterium]|nr:hypothetical protein [Candidatus Jacksonbacteria bacterium]
MDNAVAQLYQSQKTIFTNKDLSIIWRERNRDHLKAKVSYYVKRGVLNRLTRGVFAKDKNYNPLELATSIYTPCYISFETSLREAGIIFQHYETIFVAGPWSKTVSVDRRAFTFRKLKDDVLYNSAGIANNITYSIATPERAFLDTIYLMPRYYFDHLDNINWEKCFELAAIYQNKQLLKRVKEYQNIFESEQK